MKLNFQNKSDFFGVFGMKARGKTVLTIYIVKNVCRRSRFIAIDSTHQLSALGYCVHYPENIIPAWIDIPQVVYQPIIRSGEKEEDVYDTVFHEVRRARNFTLIVDEIDEHAPRWGFKSKNLQELVKRGRVLNKCGLICNSRRPADMNNAIEAHADYVACFQMQKDDDLKYMANWINIEKEKIKALPPYYYYLYDVRKGETALMQPCTITW